VRWQQTQLAEWQGWQGWQVGQVPVLGQELGLGQVPGLGQVSGLGQVPGLGLGQMLGQVWVQVMSPHPQEQVRQGQGQLQECQQVQGRGCQQRLLCCWHLQTQHVISSSALASTKGFGSGRMISYADSSTLAGPLRCPVCSMCGGVDVG
jgi:hypothetical protein